MPRHPADEDEVTAPLLPRDETCYFDRATRTYRFVPRELPSAVDLGMRVLEASRALYDSPEARAIEAAGLGDAYRRIVSKIAAAAARAIRDDINEATCRRE